MLIILSSASFASSIRDTINKFTSLVAGSSIIAKAISFRSLNMLGSIVMMAGGIWVITRIQQSTGGRNFYNMYLFVAVSVSQTVVEYFESIFLTRCSRSGSTKLIIWKSCDWFRSNGNVKWEYGKNVNF